MDYIMPLFAQCVFGIWVGVMLVFWIQSSEPERWGR